MKTRISRNIGIVSLALAASFAGVGCASKDAEDVKEDPKVDPMPKPQPKPLTALNIMQWEHFVPEYKAWTQNFVEKFGKANKFTPTLEFVASGDLIKRLEAAIKAEDGPDLIEITTPVAQFQKDLEPVTDLVEELNKEYGEQLEFCAKGTYNAVNKEYWGLGHAWVVNPDLYRIQAWSDAGYPNGPDTWEELAAGGAIIRDSLKGMGPAVIVGMGPENDSDKILRGLLWSYGASEQDENEQVSINSPETRAAMEMLKKVYDEAIRLPEVGEKTWNAGANNAKYLDGTASYLVNPISAYRSAQVEKPELAEDTGIHAPVKGPTGEGYATIGNVPIFVIPKYSKNKEAAKDYLRKYMESYSEAVDASKMFNMPCWESTTPQMFEKGGWLESDPYAPDASPSQKTRLEVLKTAASWTRHYGYPGTSNAAIGQIITEHVIPLMFKQYIIDGVPIDDAIATAETRMNEIFDEQRAAGLVK